MFYAQTLHTLLASDADIVTPTCNGRGGHPIVLKSEMIPQILAYEGPDGLRGAVRQSDCRKQRIAVPDAGVLMSVHNEPQLRQHGGKNDGRTCLTEKGWQLMYAFQRYEDEVRAFAQRRFDAVFRESGLIYQKTAQNQSVLFRRVLLRKHLNARNRTLTISKFAVPCASLLIDLLSILSDPI